MKKKIKITFARLEKLRDKLYKMGVAVYIIIPLSRKSPLIQSTLAEYLEWLSDELEIEKGYIGSYYDMSIEDTDAIFSLLVHEGYFADPYRRAKVRAEQIIRAWEQLKLSDEEVCDIVMSAKRSDEY